MDAPPIDESQAPLLGSQTLGRAGSVAEAFAQEADRSASRPEIGERERSEGQLSDVLARFSWLVSRRLSFHEKGEPVPILRHQGFGHQAKRKNRT